MEERQDRRGGGAWVLPTAAVVGVAIAGGLFYLVWQHRQPDVEPGAVVARDAGAPADVPAASPPVPAAPPSRSVGTPAHGSLVNAVALPFAGDGYEVLTAHQGRDLSWGTDELVQLVVHVGAAARANGRTVYVGNLSAREGGPIRHSKSHQSGRDVDLAFCYQSEAGTQQATPDFVSLDNDTKASHLGLELDVECTWTVVQAAMNFEPVPVQHIFASLPIERAVIAHARKNGAPRPVVERAMRLLSQPAASEDHNDHMHLRIGCPPGSDQCADRSRFRGGGRFNEPTE